MEADFIESAYTSLDQKSLKPLIDQLERVSGHPRSVYCEYSVGDTHPHRFEAKGISKDEYAPYFSHYHKENVWLKARMAETSPQCFFQGSQTVAESQLKRSTWYNEYMRPRDMADIVSFGNRGSDGRHSYLNVLTSRNSPDFSAESLKLLRAAAPHINKVLSLRRRMMDMSLESLFLRRISESRQQAHFLLDEQGRVLLTTSIADDLIAMNDGFTLSGDRFVFENYAAEQSFSRALGQTLKAITLSTDLAQPMRVERNNERTAYVFDFCPWATRDSDILPSDNYVLVTIFIPDGRLALRQELIQAGYKLTPSETRLAVDLVDGVDLKTISEARQLSLATLRNHLKSIYAKTGIHRQGELVSDMSRFLAE